MKKFLSSVALCFTLLLIGLFAFMPSSQAQDNLLVNLLNLPAPPPPNPWLPLARKERDENFFSKKNPPKDDAPIEDLLDYWRNQNQYDSKYTYTIKPSEKSLARLRDEIEKKPELLTNYLRVLPDTDETADFVKRLYEAELSARNFERSWRTAVKEWLTYHTDLFSEELFEVARQVSDSEEYVTNQDEVLALSRVDWEKARPLLEKMLGNPDQPVSQTLARWAFYKHALRVNDTFEVDKYRKELQETVENKNLKPGNRDLAMDALVESGDFEGRDEWYLSLLEDESLFELRVNGQLYTGLTTILNHSPSEKYVGKMIELAASSNPTVRNAAIRNLTTLLDDIKNPEIARALIPWLENPKWAKEAEGERRKLVEVLRHYTIPESVPGLIAILNEKESREITLTPNGNANVSVYAGNRAYSNVAVNSTVSRIQADFYPYRSAAVAALEKQKDARAVSALRQILPLVENWERHNVVKALFASNGYSIAEQIEALETLAKTNRQTEALRYANTNVVSNTAVAELSDESIVMSVPYNSSNMVTTAANVAAFPYNPYDLNALLGNHLVSSEEVSAELVSALLERIGELDTKDPPLALTLRRIIQNWKGAAINSLMLKDLKNGRASVDSVLKLLTIRKNLRETQKEEVFDLFSGKPEAAGIAACLLENDGEYSAILAGENADAKIALLGCARLIRAELPIQKVAEYLKGSNKMLATAAERYLETEDSSEARSIVLAEHPNEAKILGAKNAFIAEGSTLLFNENLRLLFISVNPMYSDLPPYFLYNEGTGVLNQDEKRLQKEVRENQQLLGVYSYDHNLIRIYNDRAVFSWTDDPARYRERTLSAEEFEGLKNFLINQRVEELPPFLSACSDCQGKQLLMLGRHGGRRVFWRAEQKPQFFAELENFFTQMRNPPARLRYRLEDKISGLEILWADERLQARNLWKNGEDFRLLIEDLPRARQIEKEIEDLQEDYLTDAESEQPEIEERIIEAERKYAQAVERKKLENFAWFRFDKAKLIDTTIQPPSIEHLPLRDNFTVNSSKQRWKARTSSVEIRANEEGLYKISGLQEAKIREGYYESPLVTPNGRWAIATKYRNEESDEEYGASLVRVNLLTGKEFRVRLEASPSYEAIAFLPALNKVLVFAGYPKYEEVDAREGDYFLLDAETGVTQKLAKGEFRPLMQQTVRQLQKAAAADEFWAAIPDREKNETSVGIYNSKTLSYKSLMTIPEIIFDSMQMWADEAENKIYFIYEGQLLALPWPKKT